MRAGTNIKLTVPGKKNIEVSGGGTKDHSKLKNLDFASSGHTGFQAELTEEQLEAIDAVKGKEDIKNKVTSLYGNETDEQYPSAKAVNAALSTQEQNNDNKFEKIINKWGIDQIDNLGSMIDGDYMDAMLTLALLAKKESLENKTDDINNVLTGDESLCYPSVKALEAFEQTYRKAGVEYIDYVEALLPEEYMNAPLTVALLKKKEDLNNKVQSFDDVTDDLAQDYYPSVKAVYDFVKGEIGDIETTLDSIIAIQTSLIGGENA